MRDRVEHRSAERAAGSPVRKDRAPTDTWRNPQPQSPQCSTKRSGLQVQARSPDSAVTGKQCDSARGREPSSFLTCDLTMGTTGLGVVRLIGDHTASHHPVTLVNHRGLTWRNRALRLFECDLKART